MVVEPLCGNNNGRGHLTNNEAANKVLFDTPGRTGHTRFHTYRGNKSSSIITTTTNRETQQDNTRRHCNAMIRKDETRLRLPQ